jgi:hypothetical protein
MSFWGFRRNVVRQNNFRRIDVVPQKYLPKNSNPKLGMNAYHPFQHDVTKLRHSAMIVILQWLPLLLMRRSTMIVIVIDSSFCNDCHCYWYVVLQWLSLLLIPHSMYNYCHCYWYVILCTVIAIVIDTSFYVQLLSLLLIRHSRYNDGEQTKTSHHYVIQRNQNSKLFLEVWIRSLQGKGGIFCHCIYFSFTQF